MRLSSFLLIFLLNVPSSESRISSRWDHLKGPNMRCLIICSRIIAANDNEFNLSNKKSFDPWLVGKINCSADLRSGIHHGTPDANGTYNGWIGSLQKHEDDIAFTFVRPDTVKFEPVKFTPPMMPADISILSRKTKQSFDERRQITSFLTLDICVYAYLISTCFFIFPVLYTFFQLSRKDRLKPKKFLKKFAGNCFRVLTVLVDQEQFEPTSMAHCVLSLSIAAFSLAAIFGILLNTVGADLVVKKEPRVIDSLDDLVDDPQFSHIRVLLLKNLYEHPLIEGSPAGSKVNKLWNRINQKSETSLLDFNRFNDQDFYNTPEYTQVMDSIIADDVAFIFVTYFAFFFEKGACYAKQLKNLDKIRDIGRKMYLAKETFGAGTLNVMLSPGIHPYVENVLNYVFRTALETGLFDGYQQRILPVLPTFVPGDLPMKYNVDLLKCAERIIDNEMTFIQFTLNDLSSVFQAWVISLLAFSFLPILEMIYSYYRKKLLRKCKQLKKRQSQFNPTIRAQNFSVVSKRRSTIIYSA